MIARLEHFYLSPAHTYFGHHGRAPSPPPTLAATEVHGVAKRGLIGDRFFGYRPDYAGQITFSSAEVFDELQRRCARPAAPRRNVITRGLDLHALINEKFCRQGVWFHGVGECKPCYWKDAAIAPGAESWLRGRSGWRARILSAGILRLGAAHLVAEARSA